MARSESHKRRIALDRLKLPERPGGEVVILIAPSLHFWSYENRRALSRFTLKKA
jgi:hypothetical protein